MMMIHASLTPGAIRSDDEKGIKLTNHKIGGYVYFHVLNETEHKVTTYEIEFANR